MGQRLVFECKRGGETFATLYFHWSAYAGETYSVAGTVINGLRKRGYDKNMTTDEVKILLLRILEQDFWSDWTDQKGEWYITHGGVDNGEGGFEYPAFQELGAEPLTENISCSDGRINITPDGMKKAIGYAEDLEEFDFDTETFTNNNFAIVEEEDLPEWTAARPEDLARIDEPDGIYWGTIRWVDVRAAMEWYDDAVKEAEHGCLGRDEDGNYIFPIG